MENYFSPKANEEQVAAILASGSVLLNAGAGSGKTFVIVGHLIQKIFDLSKSLLGNKEELEIRLPLLLERIVVMTFTKKAAGELTVRVHKKIDELIESGPYQELWTTVKSNIHKIYIGTIHGFCFRLINTGLIPDANPDSEIIDQFQLQNHIIKIVDDYLEVQSGSSEAVNSLFRSRDSIISSMTKIFSDPDLRIFWRQLDIRKNREQVLRDYLQSLGDIKNYNAIWEFSYESFLPGEKGKANAWVNIVQEVSSCISNSDYSLVGMRKLFDILLNFKVMKAPKEHSEEFFLAWELLKDFKKFASKNLDDVELFFEDFENFKVWMQELKAVYEQCEVRYQYLGLLTFADMELIVYQGLGNKIVADQVTKRFDYLIIDEFQDTSWLQYEILQRVVGNDFSKIFCVGDMKQAIYGFRGGEVGVFRDLQNKVKKPLKLAANYRSKSNVVLFNNELFRNVLSLGLEYEGADLHAVEVVDQVSSNNEVGELIKLRSKISIDDSKKISVSDIDYFEAQSIANFLESERSKNIKTCLLYRKLSASHHLITELMNRKIGFKCQVKVPYGEDPVVLVFHALVEALILKESDSKEPSKYLEFLLENILSLLGVKCDSVAKAVERVFPDINLYGIKTALHLFLTNLSLVQTESKESMKYIHSLCDSFANQWELIWVELKSKFENNYNYEFVFGEDSNLIVMMTAHASKGLQFPRVILAGIHTNGKERGSSDNIGKLPMSLKWIPKDHGKKSVRSPFMFLEFEAEKLKNFSESKRLFYVACTRAESSLVWVDLYRDKGDVQFSQNSWIVGFRKSEHLISQEIFVKDMNVSYKLNGGDGSDGEEDENSSDDESTSLKKPLFHMDSCGLIGFNDYKPNLMVISDLSVTRLASVKQCPRKFYLQNICKIDSDFLPLDNFDSNDLLKIGREEFEDTFIKKESSAERGTRIHAAISNYLLGKDQNQLAEDEIKILKWIQSLIEPYKNKELVSEKLIKFPINGFMISGTPDLVILDNQNHTAEVWDFKTGKRKEENEDHYWSQVFLYAFNLYTNHDFQEVSTRLVYVDQSVQVEKKLSKTQIVDQVNQMWGLISKSDQINRSHCSSCTFGNLCREP